MPDNADSPSYEPSLAGISVVLTALDTASGLTALTTRLIAAGFAHVVVVDDGSSSLEATFAQTDTLPGVEVVHQTNRGQGAALRTGVEQALRDPGTIGLITADADGQHSADDIIRIGRELAVAELAGESSVVLGVHDPAEEPPAIARHNRLVRRTLKLLFGRSPSDTLCGLRGLPRTSAEAALEVKGDHFDYGLKLLMAILASGISIREVPVSDNAQRPAGAFRPGRDTARNYWILLRQFLGFISTSLLGSLVDLGVYTFLIIVVFAPQSAGDVALSVVLARIISSLVNFLLNRKLVFSHHGSARQAMLRYYLLVVFILIASAAGTTLVGWLNGGHVIWAKVLVDAALFFVSYLAQKRWVFGPGDGRH